MRSSVLLIVTIVIASGAGFGGGFVAASLHDSSGNITSNQVPIITSFNVLRPVIEHNSSLYGTDGFFLNATETGTPYEAGFQVTLVGYRGNLTLDSGSFFGSINYVPLSFIGNFLFSSLPVGNYSLVASVMHGSLQVTRNASIEVLPHVSASISGPKNVNDSSGPVSVAYSASVSGGRGPYTYDWSISPPTCGAQNASLVSISGSTVNVRFELNGTYASFYGNYNGSFGLSLTVTDSLGFSYTYTSSSLNYICFYSGGYAINVTGK